jgi:hypothetical protein
VRWVVLVGVLLLPACGLGEPDYWAFSAGGATVVGANGTATAGGFSGVAIWTSDSPLEEVDEVHVTFDRVEFTRGETRWVLLDRRLRMDLLALQNGVRALLAEGRGEAGTYSTLHVRLATDGALPHFIVRNGTTLQLRLAPGAPTEFCFEGPFRMRPDETVELQLDFNVRLSVYEADGAWYLAPHGTLHDPSLAGAIEGTALPAGTRVSAQVLGREIASTISGPDGHYRLSPLHPQRYDVVASRGGYRPEIQRGVRAERTHASGPYFLLSATDASGSLRGVYGAVGGRGLVVKLIWGDALIGIAGVDPLTGRFEFPEVPADELFVEVWDHDGPLFGRRIVLVDAGFESLLEFE